MATPEEVERVEYWALPTKPIPIQPTDYNYVMPIDKGKRKTQEQSFPIQRAIDLAVTPVGDTGYDDYVKHAENKGLSARERLNKTRRLIYPTPNPPTNTNGI